VSQVKSKKAKGKSRNGAIVSGPRLGTLLLFFLFTFAFCLSVSAQDDPTELAPPPLKLISKTELAQLEAESEIKPRTKLTLDLMDARLVAAERLNANGNYDGVFRELGGFHGLMDNCIVYLQQHDKGRGKVLDNFKRIELRLRAFMPRLEAIRRDLPLRYEEYVRKLTKYVRDARSSAIEPMFADTVLKRPPKTDQ
jgi:hypothetical protein